MQGILDQAGSRGVLVITHATDSLAGFNRVLRLEDGAPEPVGAATAGAAGVVGR